MCRVYARLIKRQKQDKSLTRQSFLTENRHGLPKWKKGEKHFSLDEMQSNYHSVTSRKVMKIIVGTPNMLMAGVIKDPTMRFMRAPSRLIWSGMCVCQDIRIFISLINNVNNLCHTYVAWGAISIVHILWWYWYSIFRFYTPILSACGFKQTYVYF